MMLRSWLALPYCLHCLRLATLPLLILIRYSQGIFPSAKRANAAWRAGFSYLAV